MITGHRKIAPDKIPYVKQELRCEIDIAINQGYIHFVSGFASGIDLYFAEIIAKLKQNNPISLEAAIPYRNRMRCPDVDFKRLINQCDVIGIHSEEYTPSCFMKRNRFMVQSSELVIAVYDGREKGGTLATMRYAHALEKEVRVIRI